MGRVKIHPLIIIALLINSIAMAIYGYRSYANQETGHGIIFTLLFISLIGMGTGLQEIERLTMKKNK